MQGWIGLDWIGISRQSRDGRRRLRLRADNESSEDGIVSRNEQSGP